jgi:phospholipase D1/2
MRTTLTTQQTQQLCKGILRPGVNCWSIDEVCQTGLLIDGRDYYRAFYRAAKAARRYILIAGWQFDSSVDLLRGDDLTEADTDVRFLPFLNGLCEKNPELQVYILAWDFSLLFAFRREWWQEWIFNWGTSNRLQFRFDDCHPFAASHHQKFVVIDGHIAFVGGADICAQRWDNRCHLAEHPNRTDASAEPYGPYHEIQSYHMGPVVRLLVELFTRRWRQCGGELTLPSPPPTYDVVIEPSVALAATRVALSRTQPPMLTPPQEPVQEIHRLYLDAIATAEQLIYIENQYFSSQAIYTALVDRMRATQRSRLQIVMLLPKRPEALTEIIAVGFAQTRLLDALQDIARQTGHALGIYYTTATVGSGREKPTYIHAKLLLVDDRFLTVGSANMTNRSMGLDTEVNVSWEVSSPCQEALIQSIRQVRVSLLAEHTGVDPQQDGQGLSQTAGLVDYLNHVADSAHSRLRHHPRDAFLDETAWLQPFKPTNLVLDPEQPFFIEHPNLFADPYDAEQSKPYHASMVLTCALLVTVVWWLVFGTY